MTTTPSYDTRRVSAWRRWSLIVGALLTIPALLGGLWRPALFFPAYLYAYLFWLGIALGSLAIVMLHHLTGGGWGFVIRRILEAAFGTLPLLALLFLPLLLGLHFLYPWADPARVAADPILRNKQGMFTLPFFLVRAVIYFCAWIVMARLLRRWSLEQDRTGDPALTQRFQRWCGAWLVLYALTISLAAIDWIMSLEPRWFSTIFGMLVMAGQALTALAFAILVAQRLAAAGNPAKRTAEKQSTEIPQREQGALPDAQEEASIAHQVNPNLNANIHTPNLTDAPTLEAQLAPFWQDLGGLLNSFVLLWAYLGYGQYIITWSGDLPSENVFYLHRQQGGWKVLAWSLIVLHFALPFVLLLFGGIKRKVRRLTGIAWLLLVMHLLYLLWTVQPPFYSQGFGFLWLDLVLPFAIGGWWLAAFCTGLQRASLLPLRDPRLQKHEAAAQVQRVQEELSHG